MANEKETTTKQPGTDVATMVRARLPWHPRFEEEFKELGVTKGSWRTLVEAIWPSAKSAESVQMALSYCKARSLDPFKRPVHIVPVWSSDLNRLVETVWPGISELRTTAARTKAYAGMLPCEFGPTLKRTVKNKEGKELEIEFPEWAMVTVRKSLGTFGIVDFPGPKVFWLETYATEKRDSEWPNSMWRKRPVGQLEKCAEAASLRRAFPEEIGNEYSAEEMEGQTLHSGGVVIEHEAHAADDKGPPKGPPPVKGVEHKPEEQMNTVIEQEREREPEPVQQQPEDEDQSPQAEEVPENERKPEPAKGKKGAAADKKKAEKPPVEDLEGDYTNIVKSLQVAMKQAKESDEEKPVIDWIKESKEERKALMAKDSRIGTRLKQLITIAYEEILSGPEALDAFLKDGEVS